MTQDTRKDRRVKIVSLNVRYKSATVDEFIENHAHDVSRGGIYIKTANPFPPGTLLKFEIRLASDQAVIAGVGRVVWKRDSGQSNGERPSGMGVKFIKIDDPSKTVIDKLVNTRADAGRAFEAEPEGTGTSVPPMAAPPAVSVAPGKDTALGGMSVASEARTSTTPGMGAAPLARKATMMGLGVAGPSSRPPAPPPGLRYGADAQGSTPPTPAATSVVPVPRPGPPSPAPMFPKTDLAKDTAPRQEQTVMKQAAELLEEALREAGGSMEEIGTNPLFAGSGAKASAPPASPRPAPPEKPSSLVEDDEPTMARPRIPELTSAPPPKVAVSEPPRTSRESPTAKVVVEQDATQPSALRRLAASKSLPPAPAAPAPEPAKKGGAGALVATLVLVAAVGGGAWLYRDSLFGTGDSAERRPAPAAPETAATLAAPPPVVPPSPAPATPDTATPAAASASAAASAAAAASASTAPAPSAKGAAAATAPKPPPVAAPAPRPAPATPKAAAPSPAVGAGEEGTPAGSTAPSGGSSEAATTGGAAAAAAPATATAATPAQAPAPAPKPKAKPAAKAVDDNPY